MAQKKLASYQAKRDFTKTPEPCGKALVAPAKYPRFVIQKHAASRLHYDLRLEHKGVFKSCAVTKGPSCDPLDKRLAVEVEDHPLDYGDFEGRIPMGEYGGGTVVLWDRGSWMLEDETADVDGALRKGELKFTMDGEKLKGGWVLVRMKGGDSDRGCRNWLLIKHRDAFACENADALLAEIVLSRPGVTWIGSPQAKAVAPSRSWLCWGKPLNLEPYLVPSRSMQDRGTGRQPISAHLSRFARAARRNPGPRAAQPLSWVWRFQGPKRNCGLPQRGAAR